MTTQMTLWTVLRSALAQVPEIRTWLCWGGSGLLTALNEQLYRRDPEDEVHYQDFASLLPPSIATECLYTCVDARQC